MPKHITVEDIVSGVESLDAETAARMRLDSVHRAQEFSLDAFIARLKSFL